MDLNRLRNYVTVNTTRIAENFDKVTHGIQDAVKIMSVIKADGYGHSIAACVKALDDRTDWYATATFEEALDVRKSGSQKPVLILGYVPLESIAEAVYNNFTLTLISRAYAEEVNSVARAYDLHVSCHLKIDTGFHRIGIQVDNFDETQNDVRAIYACSNLDITGVFTHFAVAGSTDIADQEFTEDQYALFQRVCTFIRSEGHEIELCHCCNSRATLTNPEYHLDMVRIGMYLYGLGPVDDIKMLDLKAAMTWHARVVTVKDVKKGESVGYSRMFVAPKDMRIAVIGCGFGDGYFRSLFLADIPLVTINNIPCKILGKICMDYIMVDISDIDVSEDINDAILMGDPSEGYVSASVLGKLTNGTAVEVTCQVTQRVKRILVA